MCENSAQALPQGLLVESGQATVDTSSPDTLIITASDQAILSFEDFSIGANETVQFNLPDSASSVLNRVAGINASDIIGSLLSNGRIFLVNSNGIHIAPGALVQAQDFIASTLDIQNAMFLANQFSFEAVTGKMSSILNEGNIRSGNGGNVVLLAQEVMNNGLIQADLGHVVLGSASKATLNFNSEGLVNLVIDEALAERLSSNSPVTNHGQILAQGGRVTLTAEDITGALNATVNNTGVIEAAGVVEHDGIIELISNSGTASSSGSLTATTVNLTAKNIELSGSLDAQNGSLASAKEDINVTNDLTVKGNLTLEADSDQDGSGSILQSYGTLIQVGGDLTLKASQDSFLHNVEVSGGLSYLVQTPVAVFEHFIGSTIKAGSLTIGPQAVLLAKAFGSLPASAPVVVGPPQAADTGFQRTLFLIQKDWTNLGSFGPGDSRVELTGLQDSVISGNNTFNDFYVLTPEKTVSFQSGSTQDFTGALVLQGSYGKLLSVKSTQNGVPWMIRGVGASDIKFTSLQDTVYVYAHGPPTLDVSHSKHLGNNSGLTFAGLVFTGSTSSSWLDPSSWSGGFVPGIHDSVLVIYSTTDTVRLPDFFEASSITVRSGGDLITEIGSQFIVHDPYRAGDANTSALTGGSIWLESTTNIGLQGLIQTGAGGRVTVRTLGRTVMMPTSTILSPGGEVRINQPTALGFTGIYAHVATLMYPGSVIDARGGLTGGFVEVSGEVLNVDQGSIKAAEILFDPASITFSNSADANVTGFAPDADVTEALADDGGLASVFRVDGTGGSILLDVDAGATITFQAGTITISSAFNLNTATGDDNVNLVLESTGNISVNAALTATGTGSITLTADSDNDSSGALAIAAAITTAGGDIIIQTADTPNWNTSAVITTNGGDFSATNNDTAGYIWLNASSSITTAGGDVTLTSLASVTGIFPYGVISSGTGAITMNARTGVGFSGGSTTSTTGKITINADSNNDGSGQLEGHHPLTTTGGDIELTFSGQSNWASALSTGGGDVIVTNTDSSGYIWFNTGGTITTAGGLVTMNADNDIFIYDAISTGAGSITILAKDGITLTSGNADITATTGNIIIAADWDSGVDYNGNLAGVFSTASGQDITTTSGNISIYSADDPTYAGVIDTTSGGDISITNYDTGALTISVGLSTDAGDITLSSGGNVVLSAGIDLAATTGNITVTADSEVNGVGVFSTASGQDITTTSGNISITGGDAATYAGVVDTTSGGNISIINNDATGSITLSVSLSTDAGSITIESKQAITLGAGVDLTATTGNITVRANTDQNTQGVFDTDAGMDITTTSGNILIETGDTPNYGGVIDTTSGGDISITNVEAGGTITLSVSLSTDAGDITISSKSNLTFAAGVDLTTTTGSISVTADADTSGAGSFDTASGNDFTTTTGNITLYSADSSDLDGLLTTSGGDVSVTVPDTDLNIGNTISTGGGSVMLSANRDVNLTGASSDITTGAGNVTITADLEGNFIGNFSSVAGANISTTSGTVQISGSDPTPIAGDITTDGADVTIDNNDDGTVADTTISGAITTAGGAFTFTADTSGVSISGSIATTSGAVLITGRTFALTGTISSGSSTTTLQPNGSNTVGIGTSSSGTFNVTDAEADLITASVLRIGTTSSSGAVDVRTISPANTTVLSIIAGGALSQTGSTTITETSVRITAADTVTLQSGNAIDNIAVNMTSAGAGFAVSDPDTITVTTVDGVAGITTNAGAVAITGSSGITLSANMTTDGTSAGADVTLTGAVTLGAGVTIDTDDATVSDGNITFSSTINGSQILSLQSGSGTITFNGIVGGSTPMSYLETLGTVTQSAAVHADTFLHGTGTWTSGANAIDVGGFTNTGTFNAPSTTLNIAAGFFNSGTFTHNSGTVTFDGTSGTQDLTSGGDAFNHLTINDGGGTLTIQLEDALVVAGNLTITGGTLDTKASEDNSVNVAGNWINSDTFMTDGGTVTLDGAADQTFTTGGSSFFNLTINNTGAGGSDDIIVSGALDVNGDFTLTDGDLDLSTNDPDMNFAGNFTVGASGSMDASAYSGTATFDAGSGTKTITSNGQSFNSVTFNDGGGSATFELQDALTVKGNLVITGGTLDVKSGGNHQINLGADGQSVQWTNNDTFTAQNGTVLIVDGSSVTFAGTTTFYTLSATNLASDHVDITLTFTAGTTTTVSHSLVLNGLDADDRVLIRSTEVDEAATISFTGSSTFSGDYLDVEWSIATSASSGITLPLDPDDSTDGGNTTGWFAEEIEGIVYEDEGITHVGAGIPVAISVEGGAKVTGVTDADGAFQISASVSEGDVVLVFLDNDAAGVNGAMITIADALTRSGFHVYQSYLIIRSHDGATVTNDHLDTANNNNGLGDADIDSIYTLDGSDNLTMGASTELLVNDDDTYTPGANVTAVNIDINGTFSPGANDVTITGNWDSTGGTFTAGTSSVTFSGDSMSTRTITSASEVFYDLTFNGKGHWTNSDALSVSHQLTVTAGGLYQTTANITTGSETTLIGANGSWVNSSTGDVILGGDIENSGLIMFNGGGTGFGTDEIVITSSVGATQRTWSVAGRGVTILTDVDATDQDGTLTVWSSTGAAQNTDWTFSVSNIQGILWDNGGGDNLFSTANNWSGNSAPTSNDFIVFNDTSDSAAYVDSEVSVYGIYQAYEYSSNMTSLGGNRRVTAGSGGSNQKDGIFSLPNMLAVRSFYSGGNRNTVYKPYGSGEFASITIVYMGKTNTMASAFGTYADTSTSAIDLSRISTSKASASALGGGFGILSENPPDFDWGTPQALQAPQAPGAELFSPDGPAGNILSNEELSSIMAGQMAAFQDPFAGEGSFSVNPDRDLIRVL